MDLLRLNHRSRQCSLQHATILEVTHEEGLHPQESNRICHLFAWGSLIWLTFWNGSKKVEAKVEDVRREGVCRDRVGR